LHHVVDATDDSRSYRSCQTTPDLRIWRVPCLLGGVSPGYSGGVDLRCHPPGGSGRRPRGLGPCRRPAGPAHGAGHHPPPCRRNRQDLLVLALGGTGPVFIAGVAARRTGQHLCSRSSKWPPFTRSRNADWAWLKPSADPSDAGSCGPRPALLGTAPESSNLVTSDDVGSVARILDTPSGCREADLPALGSCNCVCQLHPHLP
jgi:hypothetical protein